MADQTITTDQIGAYEIPLTAGTVTKVTIANRFGFQFSRATVSVHDGTAPVYAKLGKAVTVKDPAAQVIAPGTWLDIQTGYGDTGDAVIALISATDATVSVARA